MVYFLQPWVHEWRSRALHMGDDGAGLCWPRLCGLSSDAERAWRRCSGLTSGSPSTRIAASADGRRLLHDHVSSLLQIPHDVIGGEIGHEFVAPVKALSPVESEGERDGLREVAGVGGHELVFQGAGGYTGGRTFQERKA